MHISEAELSFDQYMEYRIRGEYRIREEYRIRGEYRNRGEHPERGDSPKGCFSNFVVAQTAGYVTLISSPTRIAWALD